MVGDLLVASDCLWIFFEVGMKICGILVACISSPVDGVSKSQRMRRDGEIYAVASS